MLTEIWFQLHYDHAENSNRFDHSFIVLIENWLLMHHRKNWLLMHDANRDLTIAASCLLQTDNHCMILTENWPWPYSSEYWALWRDGNQKLIIVALYMQKILLQKFFWQEIMENLNHYCIVLEYAKKIAWSWVAEISFEIGINFVAEIFFDRKYWKM